MEKRFPLSWPNKKSAITVQGRGDLCRPFPWTVEIMRSVVMWTTPKSEPFSNIRLEERLVPPSSFAWRLLFVCILEALTLEIVKRSTFLGGVRGQGPQIEGACWGHDEERLQLRVSSLLYTFRDLNWESIMINPVCFCPSNDHYFCTAGRYPSVASWGTRALVRFLLALGFLYLPKLFFWKSFGILGTVDPWRRVVPSVKHA